MFDINQMLDKLLCDRRMYHLSINDIIDVLVSVRDVLKEEEKNVSNELQSRELLADIQSELQSID